MSQNKLAILGGNKVREKTFKIRKTIGPKEIKAVNAVLEKGDLSLFFGGPGEYYFGGPFVKEFEEKWAKKYGYKHCISTNSWTTGLMTAVGALGISPGDEVLCTPYSMSATATAILFYGGIPIFVDIEEETFNMDPKKIEEKITPRTKAIMLAHIFGHSADMDPIIAIAKKHNLKIIEDGAQCPGAKYKGKFVGALADIGGFSLNYHKHIHTGEGGLLVTNDDDLALRCKMIRNHGENAIEAFEIKNIANVMGSNYRLTEMQAAIGSVQMDYVEDYVAHRNKIAAHFTSGLKKFGCFQPPVIKEGCTHSFYVYAIKYNSEKAQLPRNLFVQAVHAELADPTNWEQDTFVEGYVKPLYWNTLYQKKIAIGNKGFPWSMNPGVEYNYSKGLCPVTERMHEKELIYSPLVREAVEIEDIDDVLKAVEKVLTNASQLKDAKHLWK